MEIINAIEAGNIKEVERLLSAGHDINGEDDDGATPLLQSINSNEMEIFKLLIARGVDVQKANSGGYNALHWMLTAEDFNPDYLPLLIDAGFDINRNLKRNDFLTFSAQFKPSAIKFLIDHGYTNYAENAVQLLSSQHIYSIKVFLLCAPLDFVQKIDYSTFQHADIIAAHVAIAEKTMLDTIQTALTSTGFKI